jgi:hypothetical protein
LSEAVNVFARHIRDEAKKLAKEVVAGSPIRVIANVALEEAARLREAIREAERLLTEASTVPVDGEKVFEAKMILRAALAAKEV